MRESEKSFSHFPRLIDVQLRRSAADFEKIVEGFGMFPNKFLQRVAPLKFAKSTSVSTRALLAKDVCILASKSKIL